MNIGIYVLNATNVVISVKNNMEEDNFPCTCGHFKMDHEYRDLYMSSPSLHYICWQCVRLLYDLNNRDYKPYHKFQPDNLKYLESKL